MDEFLKAVFDHIALLRHKWALYRQLFMEEPSRVETFNRRTGYVFHKFQRVLLDTVLLDLAKLLDRAETSGQQNLSLKGAIEKVAQNLDGEQRNTLEARLDKIKKKHEAIMTERNKRIAHTDEQVALGAVQLPKLTLNLVDEAVHDIVNLYNDILRAYDDSQANFDTIDEEVEEHVDVLLKVLERGNAELDAEREERRQLWMKCRGGRVPPENFDPGEAWAQRMRAREERDERKTNAE